MNKAYYSKPIDTEEKPPIVVPLPELKATDEPPAFTSSIFANRHDPKLASLADSSAILTKPCVHLAIGKAYDGLPLLLSISRERRIKQYILSQLGVESESSLHDSIRQPLLALEEAVQSRACATGVLETDKLGVSTKSIYKTHCDVGHLIKNTLLAQLLNDTSESSLNERGEGYKEALMDKKTTMHIGIPILSPPSDSESPTRISKPLSVKTRLKTDDIPEEERGAFGLEPLYLETFVGVLNVRYQSAQDWSVAHDAYYSSFGTGNRVYEGLVADRASYLHALSLSRTVSFLIDRHELLSKVIVPVAKEAYSTMHAKSRVHGDIKPANILLVEGAPKLIDARGCSIGGISSTYTPDWCAPEQTLGKALEATADVYAISMMVLKVLGGQIYGEVKNFRMPSATGGDSQAISVLDTEGVWLESGSGLSEESRNAWREALTRFLSFKPEKRPKDGKALAEELEKLLEAHPIKGMKPLKMEGAVGSARMKKVKMEALVGKEQVDAFPKLAGMAAWVFEDSYPNVV